MTYISPRANIESGVYIGHNVTIYGQAHIKRGAVIEDNCIIGKPSRTQMEQFQQRLWAGDITPTAADYDAAVDTPTVIGEKAMLQSGTVIYAGCTLEDGVICEDNAVVRWDTTIGAYTKLMFGVLVASYIRIGHHCRVAGFVANRVVIGNYVTTQGSLVHRYRQYGANRVEAAPVLEDYVTVGYDTNVIGGVTIGARSYVAAGSLISKDVPPDTLVMGVNEQHPLATWKGGQLQREYLASFPEDADLKIDF